MLIKLWLGSIIICLTVFVLYTYVMGVNVYNKIIEYIEKKRVDVGEEKLRFSSLIHMLIGSPHEVVFNIVTFLIPVINIVILLTLVLNMKKAEQATVARVLFVMKLRSCVSTYENDEEESGH